MPMVVTWTLFTVVVVVPLVVLEITVTLRFDERLKAKPPRICTKSPSSTSRLPVTSRSTLAATFGMLAGTRPVVFEKNVVQLSLAGLVFGLPSLSLAWFTLTMASVTLAVKPSMPMRPASRPESSRPR